MVHVFVYCGAGHAVHVRAAHDLGGLHELVVLLGLSERRINRHNVSERGLVRRSLRTVGVYHAKG